VITADTIRQALQCDNPSCACHKSGGLMHCPGHEDKTPSFSVSEKNGKILVKDFGGCSQDRVISALKEKGLWPSKNGDGFSSNKTRGLTLKALADAKRLSVESLKKWGVTDIDYKGRPAVYIPYRDLEGKTTDRFRLNLKQEPRLIWRKGSKTLLYGLWRLPEFQQAGELFLVEGETDCWTFWEYGIPALGLPGKTNWKREWAAALKGLKIYLWQEPDAPELPAKVAKPMLPEKMCLRSLEGLRAKPSPWRKPLHPHPAKNQGRNLPNRKSCSSSRRRLNFSIPPMMKVLPGYRLMATWKYGP